MLGKLPKFYDEKLLVGVETSDDAAVYQITDEIAMIQTVDFFTPVVDDPFTFGQIAAANSLSDAYAMGGEPKIALNIVGFPNCLDPEILGDILAGGASKVQEAGAVLVGGHSIQDEEPKYGLCVTGFVHPKKLWKNYGAMPGDVLILTKPVGSGVINTAVKAGMASGKAEKAAIQVMTSLNRKAKEVLERYPVHSCTDITGFGLAGHCLEMARASEVTLEIDTKAIPLIPQAEEYASMGLVPAGTYQNRSYNERDAEMGNVPESMIDLAFDPQTSGGLLAAVEETCAGEILKELQAWGLETQAAVVGRAVPKREKYLYLRE